MLNQSQLLTVFTCFSIKSCSCTVAWECVDAVTTSAAIFTRCSGAFINVYRGKTTISWFNFLLTNHSQIYRNSCVGTSISHAGLWQLMKSVMVWEVWVWRVRYYPKVCAPPLGMHVFTNGMDNPALLGHMHTAQ